MSDVHGYINPDGTGRGNWVGREPHYRRHPSEKLVMDRLGRRYNREPDDRTLTGVRLANYSLAGLILWAFILAWAVSLVR